MMSRITLNLKRMSEVDEIAYKSTGTAIFGRRWLSRSESSTMPMIVQVEMETVFGNETIDVSDAQTRKAISHKPRNPSA